MPNRRRSTHELASAHPHVLLLGGGVLALLVALIGGLARIGHAPLDAPASAVAAHGALTVFGFLGVLVGFERAVPIQRAWAFLGPASTLTGTLMLLAGASPHATGLLWGCGALLAIVAVTVTLARQPSALAVRCMLGSCVVWLAGVLLWARAGSVEVLVPWWAAFLMLMIIGERVQFGRLQWHRGSSTALLACSTILAAGLGYVLIDAVAGTAIVGISMLAFAGWLACADVRHRSRRPGLLRFVTIGLAISYAWLAASGVVWIAAADAVAGPRHDAMVHSLFVGFVMGMVLAHAPMIAPVITGIKLPFHRVQYVPVAVLHVGVAIRVAAGLRDDPSLSAVGSQLTAAALVLFVLVMAASIVAGRISARRIAPVEPPRKRRRTRDDAATRAVASSP